MIAAETPFRYRSAEEDSARWIGFPFRDSDIVISTRSKSGTTWMQMICALLVFQTPELPAPLGEISPWLDWLVTPRDDVVARLEAQDHRRIIKTHTPLDGLPIDPRAMYIVVARHPLDMAVSLYHQGSNIDRARVRELTGQAEPDAPPPEPVLHEWLMAWVERDPDRRDLDSLANIMWHLSDAWQRRREPNVVLVHYDALRSDLEGEMRHLATILNIGVAEETWPALVRASTFDSMRANANRVVPDRLGVLRDPAAFFRSGLSGAGHEALSTDELRRYEQRTAHMGPPDLLRWLHGEAWKDAARGS
jgi:aryl sulfotransferase